MDVTIIGTGKMASGIANLVLSGGNSVTFIGRNKTEADQLSRQLSSTASKGASASSATLGSPVPGDVVFLAVPYSAAIQVIRDYKSQLGEKVIVDITNPLNQSYDAVVTPPNSSAAEEISKELPAGAKIVKAFNTNFAGTLHRGEVGGQPIDVFVAGDDPEAKRKVMGIIEAGRMRPIDAGPLQRARQLEALAFLLISLQGTMKTNFMSSVKILH